MYTIFIILVSLLSFALGIIFKTKIDDDDAKDANEEINVLNAQNKLASRLLTDVMVTLDEQQQRRNQDMPSYALQITQALQSLVPEKKQRDMLREEERQRRKQLTRV